MPLSNRKAECKVMPLILNAATPVGAVSNTITSSGSIAPDNLKNLSVRIDQFNDMGFANTWTTEEDTIWLNWFAMF